MKRQLFMLILVGLSGGFISLNGMSQEEQAYQDRVKFFQGKIPLWKSPYVRRGAFEGGIQLGAVGGVLPTQVRMLAPEQAAVLVRPRGVVKEAAAGAAIGAAVGATGGAAAGATYGAARRRWIQFYINRIIAPYTQFRFQQVTPEQGMLLLAAYEQNIPMMKVAIQLPGVIEFANAPGVWQALAALYSGSASDEMVALLQRRLWQ